MRHVAFDGFDQIGNQVVSASQLHVDLRECVTDSVAQVDEIVVDGNRPKDDQRDDDQDNYGCHTRSPSICAQHTLHARGSATHELLDPVRDDALLCRYPGTGGLVR